MRNVFLQILAIIVCGGLGAFAGWFVMRFTGIEGTLGALLTIPIAVVVATAAWLVGVWMHDRRNTG
jgi:lipopolysaccharide export LptBFGC system permease protein LptF